MSTPPEATPVGVALQPAGSGSPFEPGVQAIVEAARLAERCEGYWSDQRDGMEGWTVDYAVDINVVMLFAQPAGKLRYAELISGLDTNATYALAELLGRFILLRLPAFGIHGAAALGDAGKSCAGSALVVIPPHDDEYDRVRLAVMNAALTEAIGAAEALPTLVAAVQERLPQGMTGVEALAELLASDFEFLLSALDGRSGALRELARLSQLSHRLLNLYRVPAYRNAPAAQPLLPRIHGHDTTDRADYFALVGQWRERLERHRPPRKPDHALLCDAEVMATLQMVNQRAAPLRRKLVLITGSEDLFRAGSEWRLGPDGGRFDFARAYLRHPQAFVGAKAFFERRGASPARQPVAAPAAEAEAAVGAAVSDGRQPPVARDDHSSRMRIVDWLNLFFPKALSQVRYTSGQLGADAVRTHDAAVRADVRRLRAIQRLDDQWVLATLATLAKSQFRSLTGRSFPDGVLDDLAEEINAIAVDLGVEIEGSVKAQSRVVEFLDGLSTQLGTTITVDRLHEVLAERIEHTVARLYLGTGELGVMQLIGNGDPVRGVPALRFDRHFPAASQQSETLCRKLWAGSRDFDLGGVYDELATDDPEHYHAHLLHAQVYAARGHWFACRTLSRLALQVSRRIPADRQNGRRGREAAYLMAVSERRLAKSVADLGRVREALATAQSLETPGESQDPRFRAESLACDVTELQFRRFVHGPAPTAYPVARSLDECRSILSALRATDPNAHPVSMRCWVLRQVVTNVLIVALLAEIDHLNAPDAAQQADLRGLLKRLRDAHLAPDSEKDSHGLTYPDGLSSFVYDIATVAFDTPQRAQLAAVRLAHEAPLGIGVPPFEEARKALFRQFVRDKLAPPATTSAPPAG